MRLIDLSHTFEQKMPVYPGDPSPEMIQVATISEQGYTDFQLKTGMHVGTHIDAPLHFIEGGKRLSEMPIQRFTGKAHLINVQGKTLIGEDVLSACDINRGDILLIHTGHDEYFGQDRYYLEYPLIAESFAKRAVEMGVSIVGLDTPSPDRAPYTIHKILLQEEVLIIENLTNLSLLKNASNIVVFAFPPKLALEASPVRVIARVE
jgi:kynurenine formamidase